MDISASAKVRAMDAHEYAKGFKGMKIMQAKLTLLIALKTRDALDYIRERKGRLCFMLKFPYWVIIPLVTYGMV